LAERAPEKREVTGSTPVPTTGAWAAFLREADPLARADFLSAPLRPLPAQPLGVPWPTKDWPTAEVALPPEARRLAELAFDPSSDVGQTQALVVVHGGRLVYQRYAGSIEYFDRPPDPVTPGTRLLAWSLAKSVLHAVVGILVGDGRLELGGRALAPEWRAVDDPRRAITLAHLLEMRDGLAFVEEYEDFETSDVIQMLFGSGKDDVAAFAADRPLAAPPGERYCYSSGTSNVISGLVARTVGHGDPYLRLVGDRILEPLGMASTEPGLDAAGTWVASSLLHATAEDYARFGLLYLRGGIWEDSPLLPPGWVDHGRRPRSVDPEDGHVHGAHWWAEPDGFGTFRAAGYEGQMILLVPDLDVVVVRLGKTPPSLKQELVRWRRAFVAALAPLSAPGGSGPADRRGQAPS
jgi:CubicO group peptidase (beta-lactamase class C family)